MRKFAFVIFLLTIGLLAKSTNLSVYYYSSSFYNSEVGTYLETYIAIIGNSAVFKKNENGKYQAIVEVTMLFNQEGNVKEFKKYNLKSPEIDDTTSKPNFIDLQRINLKEGLYNFELKIKDLQNENTKEFVFHDIISMSHKTNEVEISGIEYLEKYSPTQLAKTLSRNGYDMVPYVADYYPSNIKTFAFYYEIYNTKIIFGENQEFLLQYYIESTNLKQPNPNFVRTKKQKVADIIPVMGEFSIEGLETGNYNFVIEIRNKENKVIASKKSFFQRSNPKAVVNWNEIDKIEIVQTFVKDITSIDTLKQYINELYPISDVSELTYAKNAINSNDLSYLQKYFYSFWYSRSNLHPDEEWKKYKEQVDYVNNLYGSQIKKGYESDRGRVYLQYGAPNNVIESKQEPSAYPYEIWHFYVLGNQRNKRFVFYNPELVGKDYVLLHSDALGEIYDKNWERRLSKRNNSLYNFDATESDDQYGSKAKENFQK